MRYQRGSVVTLSVSPSGRTDRVPYATITMPGGGTMGIFPLAFVADSAAPLYRSSIRLRAGLVLGSYPVTYRYSIGGVLTTASDSFDVVPGGDSGGEIISLFGYDRPEGRYVLAQLGSGRLVQGRDPYL